MKNIPNDFDWKFYIDYYVDLQENGIKTQEQALNHYLQCGQFENRVYIKNNIVDINNYINNKLKYLQSDKNIQEQNGYNLIGYINQNFGLARISKYVLDILMKLNIKHNINEIISHIHKHTKNIDTTFYSYYNKNILCFNPSEYPDDDLLLNFDNIKNNIYNNGLTYLFDKNTVKNKYNIGIWFWELSELPDLWVKNSKYYNEVWACSDFMYNTYKKSLPKNIKIKKVNLPINIPPKYNKTKVKNKFNIKQNEFLCLFIFDYHSDKNRKNPYAIIETFKKTFKNNKECKLIIKSQNATQNDINEMELYINNDERIIHINETYNYDKLMMLMNACDVYISLHRSEGLGLTLMEAILLEKPTLCTNYSGNTDFCKKEWSEVVDYNLIELKSDLYESFYNSKNKVYWADPSIDDACVKLFKIYNNLKLYQKKAKLGKQWILNNYTDSFEKIIKQHNK